MSVLASYALVQTVAPTEEPITLGEAKAQCRVDIDDDNALISSLITAARQACENEISQAFVTQTWRYSLDCFPCWEIRLPRPPLVSVTTIKYYDTDGVLQTLSSSLYYVDSDSRPARITPAYGEVWPATLERMNAVQVTYSAGYGGASAVPEAIKQAVRLTVGNWYENREAVITGTIVSELPQAAKWLLMGVWHGTY